MSSHLRLSASVPRRSPIPTVLLAGFFAFAPGATAQIPAFGGTLSGTVDAGARLFGEQPTRREWFRFGEYQNRYAGAYLPALHARFSSATLVAAELRGFDVGRNDQRLGLAVFEPGRFALDLSWNQTPHIFTTTAQLAGGEPSRGVFPLPDPRPALSTFNSVPTLDRVAVRWDAGRAALSFAPHEGWDVHAEYLRTTKQGDRPMGMAFGSPGNNQREILEPIDQTTHDLRLSQEFGRANYRLQMSYDLSVFQNAMEAVVADNPLSSVNVAGSVTAQGRTALAPDNLAHTVAMSGAAGGLPMRGRLTGTFSYAWWRQNQAMLPYTINPALTVPAQPAGLNGDQRTLSLSLAATSRPAPGLNVSARYRRFAMTDKTPDLIVPLIVINDRSITAGPLERERYSHSRNTGRLDAVWRPAPDVSLKLGWNWDQWKRGTEREVPTTNEHTPRAALDVSVANWLSVRTAVSRAWRRYPFDTYTQVAAAQLPELRKLDMADRNQDRLDFSTTLTPPGDFIATLTYGLGKNDYVNSAYGVQDDHNWNIGGDISGRFQDRLTVFGSFVHEHFSVQQRNRSRATGQLSNLTWDWIGTTNDRVNTAGAGFEVTAVPDRLEARVQWEVQDARTHMLGSNPTTPTGGTAAQNAQATAVDMPPFTKRLHTVDASLRYRFAPNWSATAQYTMERFRESDVRTDGLVPAPPPPATQGDLFLGNDVLNYNAGILVITIGYNVGMAPPRLAGP